MRLKKFYGIDRTNAGIGRLGYDAGNLIFIDPEMVAAVEPRRQHQEYGTFDFCVVHLTTGNKIEVGQNSTFVGSELSEVADPSIAPD